MYNKICVAESGRPSPVFNRRQPVRMIRCCMMLALALFIPQAIQAAPVYQLQHFIDTYQAQVYGGNIGPQNSPIDYSYYGYFDNHHNLSQVNAHVHAGSLGIFDRAWNDLTYAPRRQEVIGRFTFDVVFESSGTDAIDASMNFDLSGQMLRAYDDRSFAENLSVLIGRVGYETNGGSYYEQWDGAQVATGSSGLLSGFQADGTVQMMSTGLFQDIPVNQPVQFYIQLSTINSYSNVDSRIAFEDTLSLTGFGDVFNISGPGGADITAVTSLDAGIIGNQFAVVPLPPSFVVMAIGLIGLAGVGWRPGVNEQFPGRDFNPLD